MYLDTFLPSPPNSTLAVGSLLIRTVGLKCCAEIRHQFGRAQSPCQQEIDDVLSNKGDADCERLEGDDGRMVIGFQPLRPKYNVC